MKTLNTMLAISFIWLYSNSNVVAQSNVWTLPNRYYDLNLNQDFLLPTPQSNPAVVNSSALNNNVAMGMQHPTQTIANFRYSGEPSHYSHNAFVNPLTGELMGWIIDGVIYDKDGYLIDVLCGVAPPPHENYSFVMGRSETIIVPDPGNCKRFYIISSITDYYQTATYGNIPYYSIIDFSKPNVYLNYPIGHPQHNPNALFGALETLPQQANAISLINFNHPPNNVPGYPPSNPYYILSNDNSSVMALSKLCNGEYMLIVQVTDGGLLKYKITSSGIIYINYSNLPSIAFNTIGNQPEVIGTYGLETRPELELKRLANGNLRLAGRTQAIPDSEMLYVADFDAMGNYIANTFRYHIMPNPNSEDRAYIYGIELSPDANYVYFTHLANSANPHAMECWNITNNTVIPIISDSATFANDFRKSHIETDANGNLYLATSNRLAQLTNSNNPDPANFSNNFLPGLNYPISTYLNLHLLQNIYPLNDQIDDEVGCNGAGLSCSCCRFYQEYDINVFTATQSAIWTPTSNPINNGTGNIVYIRDSLIIPAGINITIRDMEFRFAADAKVIVRRGSGTAGGGRLTLERTTFTADTRCCEALWQGVEVWGYNNLSQNPLNTTNKQGFMRMIDSSVVEHAVRGVALVKITPQTGYNFSHTGGVIQATNSFFKNNRIDVEFRNYVFYVNNSPQNNRSFFTNTEFLTNQQMYANTAPLTHVHMTGVYNVYFRGCDFKNTVPHLYTTNNRGQGIVSYFSQFHVLPRCLTLNCSGIDKGSFENLWYGIRAFSAFNSFTFTADRNDFIQNYYGIQATSVDYLQITRNNFDIIATSPQNPQASYGVYLNTCTGYKVEENDLNTVNAYNSSRGIIVNNSVNNLVANNIPFVTGLNGAYNLL